MSALRNLEASPNPFFRKDVKALAGSLKGDGTIDPTYYQRVFKPEPPRWKDWTPWEAICLGIPRQAR
jgi:hypothetical protein